MESILGLTLICFIILMYGLGLWSRKRIHNEVDFLVAGRRLPLLLSSATLLATWFGAGTMLTATDEVRRVGLQAIALEPLGSGFCLILAGLFVAAPLWKMNLLTLSDFFRRRFGEKAELYSGLILVPSYFGWIAVQFLALAEMLELLFGIETAYGVVLIAVLGTGYTLLGGMWSVTLTDAVQIIFLLAGLVLLGFTSVVSLGGGFIEGLGVISNESPPSALTIVPTETWQDLLQWVGIFCIAALGNIPTQDLTQRIFAAQSESVARRACWIAGVAYIFFGLIPVSLGLISTILFPEALDQAILPLLARKLLTPGLLVVFILALTSAVLSTIDSAILAPAAILGNNLLPRIISARYSTLTLTRFSIVGVALFSVATAFLGKSTYSLLEEAYALTLVGLLVPLLAGIYEKTRGERAAVLSMFVGSLLWFVHFILDWESFLESWLDPLGLRLPVALTATIAGLFTYFLVRERKERPNAATSSLNLR